MSWLQVAEPELEPQSSASKLQRPLELAAPPAGIVGSLPASLGRLSFCSAPSTRLSRRKTRSSQRISRHLRSKDKVEKLATMVGENGSVLQRVTRAAAAAAAASVATAPPSPTCRSPTVLTKNPKESPTQCQLVPAVEIGASERRSAEQYLDHLQSALAPTSTLAPASHIPSSSDEDSTPQKAEAGRLESVTVSSLMTTPRDPKGRGAGAGRSASKLRIAVAAPGPQDSPSSPASPWRERVLAPLQPDNFSTPVGARVDRQSVRRSLIAPSSPGPQASLAQNRSPVSKEESTVRRSSRRIARKAAKEPTASARIICESWLGVGQNCRGWSFVPGSAEGVGGPLSKELSTELSVMM